LTAAASDRPLIEKNSLWGRLNIQKRELCVKEGLEQEVLSVKKSPGFGFDWPGLLTSWGGFAILLTGRLNLNAA
jgi:hypothetical protein